MKVPFLGKKKMVLLVVSPITGIRIFFTGDGKSSWDTGGESSVTYKAKESYICESLLLCNIGIAFTFYAR